METWTYFDTLIKEHKFDKVVKELEILNIQQKLFCNEEDYTKWKAYLSSNLKTMVYPEFETLSQREEFLMCLLKCFQILNDTCGELACKFELILQRPTATVEDWIALGDECFNNNYNGGAGAAYRSALHLLRQCNSDPQQCHQLSMMCFYKISLNFQQQNKPAEALAAERMYTHHFNELERIQTLKQQFKRKQIRNTLLYNAQLRTVCKRIQLKKKLLQLHEQLKAEEIDSS